MYEDAKTRMIVGGKITRKIKINAGVKRGCPLSPLLLNLNNLIINGLLEEMQKLSVAVDANAKLLCCMAFADDLVLITEENTHADFVRTL